MAKAIERGEERRLREPPATAIEYHSADRSFRISFASRPDVLLPVKHFPELADLSDQELASMTLELQGEALCLEEKDLHISVHGLVEVVEKHG